MTTRAEFSKNTKLIMWERCGGFCECDEHKGLRFKIIGKPIYDHHPIPASLGGPNTPENGRVLDPKCNRVITYEHDIPALAKSQRIYEKRAGVRKAKGRPFPKRPKGQQWGRYE